MIHLGTRRKKGLTLGGGKISVKELWSCACHYLDAELIKDGATGGERGGEETENRTRESGKKDRGGVNRETGFWVQKKVWERRKKKLASTRPIMMSRNRRRKWGGCCGRAP